MNAQPHPRWRLSPMHPAHLDEIMAIERRAYPYPWTRGIFEDCLRVGYSCWVASDTVGRSLGYGIMTMAVGEAHLLNLCIDPPQQRQGLARHLLDHLVDIARHAACEQMLLEVRGSNSAALGLYAAYGFVQIGLRRGYYPADQGREDARVLSLRLTGAV